MSQFKPARDSHGRELVAQSASHKRFFCLQDWTYQAVTLKTSECFQRRLTRSGKIGRSIMVTNHIWHSATGISGWDNIVLDEMRWWNY